MDAQTALPHALSHCQQKGYLQAGDFARLAQTSRFFNLYLKDINQINKVQLTQTLQQAIIDANLHQIRYLLEEYPSLLFVKPDQETVVESQLTWKKFIGEIPFVMALKTKQVAVIEALLLYLENIESGQERALEFWDIVDNIPAKQPYDFNSLLSLIKEENPIHPTPSFETEQALTNFRDSLLPAKPIKLDEDYDPLKNLYEACLAFSIFFNRLSREQREFYSTYVYGFAQSVLYPEHSKNFDHRLNLEQGYTEQTLATVDKFEQKSLPFFYRSSPLSKSGLGFDYFACTYEEENNILNRKMSHKTQLMVNGLINARDQHINQLKKQLQKGLLENQNHFGNDSCRIS